MAYSFEKDIQPAVFSITSVTALYCIYETGKTLLPSGYLLKDEQKKYVDKLKKEKIASSVIQQSIAYVVQKIKTAGVKPAI